MDFWRQVARLTFMDGRARIAWNLRRMRAGLGLTQEALGADAGVAAPYLSRIERGAANPTIDVIERLAGILMVDVSELLAEPDIRQGRPEPLRSGRKSKAT